MWIRCGGGGVVWSAIIMDWMYGMDREELGGCRTSGAAILCFNA